MRHGKWYTYAFNIYHVQQRTKCISCTLRVIFILSFLFFLSAFVFFAVTKLHAAALQSMTFSPISESFLTHYLSSFFPPNRHFFPTKPHTHTLSDSPSVSLLHHMFLGAAFLYPPCCRSHSVLFLSAAPESLFISQPFPPAALSDPWLGVPNTEATGAPHSAGSFNGVTHWYIMNWSVESSQQWAWALSV